MTTNNDAPVMPASERPLGTLRERLLGLVIFTGFALLLCSLPVGAIVGYQASQDQWQLGWAVFLAFSMSMVMLVVGATLMKLGVLFSLRQSKEN